MGQGNNKEKLKEEIQEAVEYIFNQPKPKKERFISFYSYCKGVGGAKNYGKTLDLCGDKNCYNCRNFKKLFKEEVEKQLKYLNDED